MSDRARGCQAGCGGRQGALLPRDRAATKAALLPPPPIRGSIRLPVSPQLGSCRRRGLCRPLIHAKYVTGEC